MDPEAGLGRAIQGYPGHSIAMSQVEGMKSVFVVTWDLEQLQYSNEERLGSRRWRGAGIRERDELRQQFKLSMHVLMKLHFSIPSFLTEHNKRRPMSEIKCIQRLKGAVVQYMQVTAVKLWQWLSQDDRSHQAPQRTLDPNQLMPRRLIQWSHTGPLKKCVTH